MLLQTSPADPDGAKQISGTEGQQELTGAGTTSLAVRHLTQQTGAKEQTGAKCYYYLFA